MSSKLLHTLKDENPNLHKQFSCMNGFFQIFGRRQFLTGQCANKGQKKTPPIPGESDNHGVEPNSALRKASGRRAKKVAKEKQRASTESSRTSFSSSSCSSSFSSLECSRITQLEQSSYVQSKLSENPSREFPINLQDIVKDSVYKATSVLSVKTVTKEEVQNHIFKHIDSPRPLNLQKSAKQRYLDLSESFQGANKLQQAQEKDGSRVLTTRYASRDGSRLLTRDAPRFSFDGRESRDTFKSLKIKEIPRLSLDSRQSAVRAMIPEMKSNSDPQQELGSYKRQSSVVAKLMGLEAFPGDMSSQENQTGDNKPSPEKEVESISRSARASYESKRNPVSGSPQNSHKDSNSPRIRNADSVTKSSVSSKFPTEPAPWSRGCQVPGLKANTKASNLSASVYGEIQRRLADIEFKKSGKDLRALKRVLEAMQKSPEISESRKNNQGTNLASQTSSNGSLKQSSTLSNQGNLKSSNSTIIKGCSSPRSSRSLNMILKPATPVDRANNTDSGGCKFQTSTANRKGSVDNQSTKDPTQGGNPWTLHSADIRVQTSRSLQTLKVAIHVKGENDTSSGKSSGTKSPRLQKKNGPQKQTCIDATPSDSSKTRRQLSRQVTESGSPGTKQKPISPRPQQRNNQLKETSSKIRDLKDCGNVISKQSESNTCLALQTETEATSTNGFDRNRTFLQDYGQKQKNLEFKLIENGAVAESAGIILEQPSPISVLDATFYRDESPSPVKKVTNIYKDEKALTFDKAERTSPDLNHQLQTNASNLRPESDHYTYENIQHLVSCMGQDESTYYINVLPEDSNPEHRYIYRILLTSGLLRDLDFVVAVVPFQPQCNPIDPKVFLAVEQSMESIQLSNDEHLGRNISHEKSVQKIQRKLIFDAVNETLGQKLVQEGCSKQWVSPNKLAGRRLKGQQVLRELCSYIDQLQAKTSSSSTEDWDDGLTSILWGDLMPQSTDGSNYPIEVSGLVLDIDKLIFRDLINEVVNGETVSLQTRSGGYRRQLFY